MSKEEKKIPVYSLLVLRKDDQHIELLESNNYDEIFERYKEVKDHWAQCIKDQAPFELLKPVVTVFDPGLIYEITIKLVTETPSSRYENPYQQQMQKQGLTSMINNRRPQVATAEGDLLDGGYR
jgi:hypothetical protein